MSVSVNSYLPLQIVFRKPVSVTPGAMTALDHLIKLKNYMLRMKKEEALGSALDSGWVVVEGGF